MQQVEGEVLYKVPPPGTASSDPTHVPPTTLHPLAHVHTDQPDDADSLSEPEPETHADLVDDKTLLHHTEYLQLGHAEYLRAKQIIDQLFETHPQRN
jgi:hypothetical protein